VEDAGDEPEWMGEPRETVSDRRNGDDGDEETVEDVLDVDRDAVDTEEETAIVRWEDPTVANILADVREYFEQNGDEGFADPPSDEFVATRFFDFSFLERYDLVEYRWARCPFALVAVVYDEVEYEHRYVVVEPEMNEFERYVRQDMVELLRNVLLYEEFTDEDDRRVVFEREVKSMLLDNAPTVERGTLHKLLYYLVRDFLDFGPIDPVMRDPAVEDVSCDGTNVPVFLYHREYRDLQTNIRFDRETLDSFAFRMAQRAGKQLTVSSPLVDATLQNGSRVQITLGGDVSTRGSNFTIRKFADIPFTPVDLIRWNTFSAEQMAYYWIAIQNNKSLIFAGGTGSGKTSSMNAISFFIPPRSKVVTIEDTREIDLPHENWIQSVTRAGTGGEGRGEVTMFNLLQSALRQRPEYLIVGEIRTEERVAQTFFQAMSTGHTAYTTLHADSVETVISRLQNAPLNVPVQMLQDLDIVSVQQQTYIDDRRVRRNKTTAEVLPPEYSQNDVQTRAIFRRDAETDTHEKVTESPLMQEIATDRGWDEETLEAELSERVELLEYLAEERITGYVEVASAIQLYDKESSLVMDPVREGRLTPDYLRGRGPEIEDMDPAGLEARAHFEEE
jgi:flagellar protein FlaI